MPRGETKDHVLIKGFGFHFEGEGRVATGVMWLGAVATIAGRLIVLAMMLMPVLLAG